MKLFWGSIVFISVASFAPLASGSPDWTNSGPDNSWDNALNWTTATSVGVLPNAGSSVHIFPGFTTFPNGFGTDITVQIGGPTTVTINTPNNQTINGLLSSSVFDSNGISNGVLNLNFTNGSLLTVGGEGTVITGANTTNFNGNLVVSGPFTVGTSFSVIDPGQVFGPGTFVMTAGTANLNGLVTIGSGTTGLISQNSSTVNVNGNMVIGTGSGGNGNYQLSNGSVLQLTSGTGVTAIGVTAGSTGILSLNNTSTLNIAGDLQVGALGSGAVVQGVVGQGAGPVVNMTGASSMEIGNSNGSGGAYTLNEGTLNVNTTLGISIGVNAGSNGVLTQVNGAINGGASSQFLVGINGTGQYNISGGTANFQNIFIVGKGTGTGAVNQTGGSVVVGPAQVASIGQSTGTGAYNLSGGTVDFQGGMTVGAKGTFTQSGGQLSTEGVATIAGNHVQNGGNSFFNGSLVIGGNLYLNNGTLQVAQDQISGAGALNFGGGTLKLTAGTTAPGNPYTLTPTVNLVGGNSTIDVSSTAINSFKFAAPLAGGGGISLVGNGITSFNFASNGGATNNNTYVGPTSIFNGTLNANQNDLVNSSSLTAGSGGALNIVMNAGTGGFAYGRSINGPGTLLLSFGTAGNTFVATNTGGFTGSIVMGQDSVKGTLQVYNGTLANVTDPNNTGSGVVIGGPLPSGLAGSVNVPTSGSVTMPGSYLYTGNTQVNPGFTLYGNTFAGSVTNLGTLSTLGGLGTSGRMNIGGPLISSGVINVFANGQNSNQYFVTGASTLSGVINTVGSGTKSYQVITSGAGMLTIGGNGNLNNPNGLNTNPALTLFSSNLSIDPTNSILIVNTVQKPLIGFAQTPNQRALANSLDPLTQTPPPAFAVLLTILNNIPGSELPAAMDQLTPESLQYSTPIAVENATFMVQRVNNALSNLRTGYSGVDSSGVSFSQPGFNSGLSKSMSSLLASNAPSFHTTAPNGVNYYPDDGSSTPVQSDYTPTAPPSRMTPSQAATPTTYNNQVMTDSPLPMRTSEPPTLRTSRFSEFVAGDVILADLNQTQNMPSKASYTAGDIMAGVSFRMTSNLSVGVLFDYNHTNAKTDTNGSKTTVDSFSPGVFATYSKDDFYVNGLFSFGFNQYNNSRNIAFLGSTANSSPSGQQYVGDIDFGYNFHPAKNWMVTPTLGLTYTHLDVDSFSETGAPLANLNVNSQSVDSLRSRLGGQVGYVTRVGNIILQPTVSAAWQHEYLGNGSGITSSFQAYSASPFTIQTSSPSTDSALLGCGLTATLDNSMAFYLNYMADVGAGDYLAQSIIGGVKASF